MLTQKILKILMTYDPVTGSCISNLDNEEIIKTNINGYITINILNKSYVAHRLAWLYMTGEWPKNLIDHKNKIRNDNKWENLREATYQENNRNRGVQKNNKCGFKGVMFEKRTNKFRAVIYIAGNKKCLGRYSSAEEASKAYSSAALDIFGEFANVANG